MRVAVKLSLYAVLSAALLPVNAASQTAVPSNAPGYTAEILAQNVDNITVKHAGSCADRLSTLRLQKINSAPVFSSKSKKEARKQEAALYEKHRDVFKAYIKQNASIDELKARKKQSRKYDTAEVVALGLGGRSQQQSYMKRIAHDGYNCMRIVINAREKYLASAQNTLQKTTVNAAAQVAREPIK